MIKIGSATLIWMILFFCIAGNAQNPSYEFRSTSGQNLENALNAFGNLYGLKFTYPSYIFDHIYPGEQGISDADLKTVLDKILGSSEIEYQILDNRNILLRKINTTHNDGYLEEGKVVLNGQIVDGAQSKPLGYACIAIPNQQIGTYTDEYGHFSLPFSEVALDDHALITYIGYESERISLRELMEQKSIKLKRANFEIEEITVQSTKPVVVVDQLSASTGIKLNAITNLGSNAIQSDDVLRRIQFMPGISASDDKSSAIQIRGADESETLVLIDGIPIYRTDHFYGIFSNVNGNYIDDVTLYKNEMPINYSGKSGGMVYMTSENKVKTFSGSVQVDMLNSSVQIGQPIGGGWSFLLAGRASYNNIANAGFFENDSNLEFFNNGNVDFNRPTVLGITPSFYFYDFNTKLAYEDERISFNANFFRSLDNLSTGFENTFLTRGPNRRPITNEEVFSNAETWKNNGASLNFSLRMKDDWSLSSNSYYSEFDDLGNLHFSVTNDHLDRPLDRSVANLRNNTVRGLGSTLMLSKKVDHTTYNIGANTIFHDTSIGLREDARQILHNEKSSTEIGIFGSIEQKVNENFSLSGGLRADYYDLTDKFYFAPQLSGTYRADDNWSFKSSFSINYQYVRELSYSSRFGQEIELFTLSEGNFFPVGESTNFMVGGTYKKDNWLFDLEIYHIDRDNVLGFTTFLPRLLNGSENARYRILRGEGATNGADLMITYQSKNYKGLLSYTLSKSENNFPQIFGNSSFPTQDDRRHQLSFTNTYSYNAFDFSANAVYSSGRIFTDLNLIRATDDRRNVSPDHFVRRLPDYARFDLGTAYNFDLLHKKAKIELSVLNLLNRENVKYLQFTVLVPINQDNVQALSEAVLGTQTNQLDRTFNVSFQLKF